MDILKTGMRYRKAFLLLGLALLLKVLSLNPAWVETYHTYGLYPGLSRVMRLFTMWLPFSFGDLLYATAGIGIIYFVWKSIQAIRKAGFKKWWRPAFYKIFCVLLLVYILFNALWGLNYNRQ